MPLSEPTPTRWRRRATAGVIGVLPGGSDREGHGAPSSSSSAAGPGRAPAHYDALGMTFMSTVRATPVRGLRQRSSTTARPASSGRATSSPAAGGRRLDAAGRGHGAEPESGHAWAPDPRHIGGTPLVPGHLAIFGRVEVWASGWGNPGGSVKDRTEVSLVQRGAFRRPPSGKVVIDSS